MKKFYVIYSGWGPSEYDGMEVLDTEEQVIAFCNDAENMRRADGTRERNIDCIIEGTLRKVEPVETVKRYKMLPKGA